MSPHSHPFCLPLSHCPQGESGIKGSARINTQPKTRSHMRTHGAERLHLKRGSSKLWQWRLRLKHRRVRWLNVMACVLTHSLNSVLVPLYKCLQYGGCVIWCKTEGGEGSWNWHYFAAEWEFDCSISPSLIMSFPISQHLIPVLMHSAKLVPMNTHRSAGMMMNWYSALDCHDMVIKLFPTLRNWQ